jgi:hypothetical protein
MFMSTFSPGTVVQCVCSRYRASHTISQSLSIANACCMRGARAMLATVK